MTIRIEFCAFCGILVPEGQPTTIHPRCENCDNDITENSHRLVGVFKDDDGQRLRDACLGLNVPGEL